jgi:hypothetical protein
MGKWRVEDERTYFTKSTQDHQKTTSKEVPSNAG